MSKKIITIFLFLILTGCGFSPIYIDNSDQKFNIEVLNSSGDREINNYISNNLIKYIDYNLDNKIEINLNTSYSKTSISKDSQGSSTSYKLTATTNFKIKLNGKTKTVSFTEKLILNRLDDVFEEKRYETRMKENIAILIVKKLIRYLKIDK